MFFSLYSLPELLLTYRYAIIFPVAVLEGPVISILSGLLIASGAVNAYLVFTLLVAADLIGDMLFYCIGRYGGNPFLRRWGRYVGVDEEALAKMEVYFRERGGKLLLLGKTQAIGGAILAAAGASKMPVRRFLEINAAGTLVKTTLLLAIGFYFGKAYVLLNDYIMRVAVISTFALIAGSIIYFLYSKRRKI